MLNASLLTGAFFLLLLAGRPATDFMRRWERRVLSGRDGSWSLRWLRVSSWLGVQTALFEGRPEAALEARAIWHAMLDTRPGFIWMVRHGLLIVLAAFLLLGGDVTCPTELDRCPRRSILAGRARSGSSRGFRPLSRNLRKPVAAAIDMVHLLGAGIWVGGLPPLALLLYGASRNAATPDPYAVRTMQRFSRVALVTVLILAGSGIASAWLLVGGAAGLVGTTHGHLLLAKLAVLVPALLLAAANRALLPALSSPNAAKAVRDRAAHGIVHRD